MKYSSVVWDLDQILCVHECVLLSKKNLWRYQFMVDDYHITMLQITYVGKVMLIGDNDQWFSDKEDRDVKIDSPNQKR